MASLSSPALRVSNFFPLYRGRVGGVNTGTEDTKGCWATSSLGGGSGDFGDSGGVSYWEEGVDEEQSIPTGGGGG